MLHERVLFLGPENSPIFTWLLEQSEQVIQTSDLISSSFVRNHEFTFLISCGYRHILRKNILEIFPNKAINLHISYLPWNRGADPNLWSFIDSTPKGVTIHYLDEGVDTGDIIIQERIEFDLEQETLASSYKKLKVALENLFKENWQNIKNGKGQRLKQIDQGTSHKTRDKERISHLLTDAWNTPLSSLTGFHK